MEVNGSAMSTISRDNTAGEDHRHATLFAQFGQRLRPTGLSGSGRPPTNSTSESPTALGSTTNFSNNSEDSREYGIADRMSMGLESSGDGGDQDSQQTSPISSSRTSLDDESMAEMSKELETLRQSTRRLDANRRFIRQGTSRILRHAHRS